MNTDEGFITLHGKGQKTFFVFVFCFGDTEQINLCGIFIMFTGLKGPSTNFCLNLIFWIVMGGGITHFGQRGLNSKNHLN